MLTSWGSSRELGKNIDLIISSRLVEIDEKTYQESLAASTNRKINHLAEKVKIIPKLMSLTVEKPVN